jgi:hypothetical protein
MSTFICTVSKVLVQFCNQLSDYHLRYRRHLLVPLVMAQAQVQAQARVQARVLAQVQVQARAY